jgi:hypothetical protein
MQNRFFPGELRMHRKKRRSQKVLPARMSSSASEAERCRHLRIHHLARDRAARIERRVAPNLLADRRRFLMPAKAALAGISLVLIAVVVV